MVLDEKRPKLDTKNTKMFVLGYYEGTKAFGWEKVLPRNL